MSVTKKRGRSESQQPTTTTTQKKLKNEGTPFSRINVLNEQRAFIVDFETNLPPPELFDEVDIELDFGTKPNSKEITTSVRNTSSLTQYTGKQDCSEKVYIGIFNKETKQLDLVPSDYFRMKSQGPELNTNDHNPQANRFQRSLDKATNLTDYRSKKRALANKFGTLRNYNMTFKYQQEEVNENDSKELAKKIYEKLDEMAVEKK